MSIYSYIGRGEIYLKNRAVAASAPVSIGNCSELQITTEEDVQTLNDFTRGGGGKDDELRRISSVRASFNLHNLSPANLAIALNADVDVPNTGAVTDEEHIAYSGGLVDFTKLPDTSEAITVTDDPMTVTYVEGTDYIVNGAGIVPLAGGDIADASNILVSYTPIASTTIEALTQASSEFKFTFVGLNEAKSNRPVVVELHRWKNGVLGSLPLITDEFAGPTLSGECLRDGAITGATLSQFFRVRMANAAA
ncbi:MAG: hypothetical protein ABF296_09440 [Oceanococcaceae bacterium]